MTTQATAGYGTTFTYDGTAVGEMQTPMPPNVTTDVTEVTHHGSTDAFKEYIPTLNDGGTLSFDSNYVPGDAGQTKLMTDLGTTPRPTRTCTCVLPGTLGTATFSAFLTGFQPTPALDGKVGLTWTIQITGPVTYS